MVQAVVGNPTISAVTTCRVAVATEAAAIVRPYLPLFSTTTIAVLWLPALLWPCPCRPQIGSVRIRMGVARVTSRSPPSHIGQARTKPRSAHWQSRATRAADQCHGVGLIRRSRTRLIESRAESE